MNKYDFTTYSIRNQLSNDGHDKRHCECEECCTHEDTECGYCIDCGTYVLDNYDNEPEINPDR